MNLKKPNKKTFSNDKIGRVNQFSKYVSENKKIKKLVKKIAILEENEKNLKIDEGKLKKSEQSLNKIQVNHFNNSITINEI